MNYTRLVDGMSYWDCLTQIMEVKAKYIYKDNSNGWKNAPIVFECDAKSVSEADALYEQKFGIKPEKQKHIGVNWIYYVV